MMRVCHFTSAHQSTDDRIFLKEARSLCDAGFDVCIVARGNDDCIDGIRICGCGEPRGRLDRMVRLAREVYKKARSLDCDVYHFHDPELLPYGMKLARLGKRVIFDSHEDVPSQIMDKEWIPKPLRAVVAWAYRRYETHVVRRLDAVVSATPYIGKQFENRARQIVVVNNFPRLDDIKFQARPFIERDSVVCYAGVIDELRGEGTMVEAAKQVGCTLLLAGRHGHKDDEITEMQNIVYLGHLDRLAINELYGKSLCGLVLLQPTRAYINSLPIKMFEYMAAGLPFVCSDFPLWKSIVQETNAGVLVNPNSISEVTAAIKSLLSDRNASQEMGKRGRVAVELKYNWDVESKKLIALYNDMFRR